MAYTKFYDPWHNAEAATGGGDTSTPLTAAAMDHIEDGIEAAAAVADGAIPEAIFDAKGYLLVGSAADAYIRKDIGSDNAVLAASAGDTGGVVWKKVGNAMIADDAAIAISKLEGYPSDGTKALFGDGTWDVPAGGATLIEHSERATDYTLTNAPVAVIAGVSRSYTAIPTTFEFFCAQVSYGSDVVIFELYDNTTLLFIWGAQITTTATFLTTRLTPTAGTHVYQIRARSNPNASGTLLAASRAPMTFRILTGI